MKINLIPKFAAGSMFVLAAMYGTQANAVEVPITVQAENCWSDLSAEVVGSNALRDGCYTTLNWRVGSEPMSSLNVLNNGAQELSNNGDTVLNNLFTHQNNVIAGGEFSWTGTLQTQLMVMQDDGSAFGIVPLDSGIVMTDFSFFESANDGTCTDDPGNGVINPELSNCDDFFTFSSQAFDEMVMMGNEWFRLFTSFDTTNATISSLNGENVIHTAEGVPSTFAISTNLERVIHVPVPGTLGLLGLGLAGLGFAARKKQQA